VLLWNLVLALVWTALTGEFTTSSFVVGMLLGSAVLVVARGPGEGRRYVRKAGQLVRFLLYFAWEMLVANLRVAWDVVTPRHRSRPAILAIPLEARTDGEIILLANVITLTPGTLSLDVSPDRSTLYVHAMYVADPADLRRQIKIGFERRLLELLR
jgi:multicomponent Na+:H+ antiporter subunit E